MLEEKKPLLSPRRRRLLAYIVVAAAVAFGLYKVDRVADEAAEAAKKADQTATDFVAAQEREAVQQEIEALASCRLRNTFQLNSRNGDGSIITAFENAFLAGADTPEEQARVHQLADVARAEVFGERTPESEDRDCDGDGQLTDNDYDME